MAENTLADLELRKKRKVIVLLTRLVMAVQFDVLFVKDSLGFSCPLFFSKQDLHISFGIHKMIFFYFFRCLLCM